MYIYYEATKLFTRIGKSPFFINGLALCASKILLSGIFGRFQIKIPGPNVFAGVSSMHWAA